MENELVVANGPMALQSAHHDIGEWVGGKIGLANAELDEIEKAIATAIERKWATKDIKRRETALKKYKSFLEKIAGAVSAGYAIVPNFDMDVLAVRTNGQIPGAESTDRPRIGAAKLPIGKGEYVSPEPEMCSWQQDYTDCKGVAKTRTMFSVTANAPVAVPFVLMEKTLADVLHKAMQEKLFDEIGIVNARRKGDPVLVGRIHHPKHQSTRWWDNRKAVSFFIGWWFDTSALSEKG